MTEGQSPARRRRRRRATGAQGAPAERETPVPGPDAAPGAVPAHDAPTTSEPPRAPKRSRPPRESPERGLRDLVGAGKSQLGVSGALRGRDVNRPSDEDIAEAEQSLVIVRRHWQPPPDAPKP